LAEGAGLVLADRYDILSHNAALAGTTIQLLWASPLFSLILFLAFGIITWLVFLILRKGSLKIALFLFAFLMFFDGLSLPDRIHWVGAVLLSFGLATVVLRNFHRFESKWLPFCRVTVPALALLAGLAWFLVQSVPKWQEEELLSNLPEARSGNHFSFCSLVPSLIRARYPID